MAHFNLRNCSVTILDGFITHDQHAPIDILAVPRNDGHCLSCFGRLQVSLTQVHTFANFIVHHIRMTDLETGHEHRVTHLNFTTWPDLGTPKSAIPLLQVGVLCGVGDILNVVPGYCGCSWVLGPTQWFQFIQTRLATPVSSIEYRTQFWYRKISRKLWYRPSFSDNEMNISCHPSGDNEEHILSPLW